MNHLQRAEEILLNRHQFLGEFREISARESPERAIIIRRRLGDTLIPLGDLVVNDDETWLITERLALKHRHLALAYLGLEYVTRVGDRAEAQEAFDVALRKAQEDSLDLD
mgnify:CR=1 FL=1